MTSLSADIEALATQWERAAADTEASADDRNVVGLVRAGCYRAHAASLREILAKCSEQSDA